MRFGYIYQFSFPPQEVIDSPRDRRSLGAEQYGIHHALVVSSDEFNVNPRGVIVVPLTSTQRDYERIPVTWVRVISDNKPAFVMCEQIRYVDLRRHVRGHEEKLRDYDLKEVQKRLKLLIPMMVNLSNAA